VVPHCACAVTAPHFDVSAHPVIKGVINVRRIEVILDPGRARLRFPMAIAAAAALLFIASLGVIPFLGAEFLPRLDEGSILVMMYRVPGISISESLHGNEIIETVLKQFPEVDKVVCRTGRPEVAVDPMAIDQSDVYVMLKPVSEWPSGRSKDELVTAMKQALEKEAPGAA
jgi:heavy metal efflux system protein